MALKPNRTDLLVSETQSGSVAVVRMLNSMTGNKRNDNPLLPIFHCVFSATTSFLKIFSFRHSPPTLKVKAGIKSWELVRRAFLYGITVAT